MLQYKIPQNVGIEDRIVGPFSLRQMIIIAIGGGASYILFAITSKIYELNIIEYILLAIPALLSLAIAMLKIHNVTFGKYILLMLEFAIKPKKRMWDHRGISALVAPDLTDKTAAAKKTGPAETKGKKNVNLRDLSATLDSGGFEHVEQVTHEDIDEVKDDDLITEAYFGNKQKSKEDNMYWRTRDMQKKKLELLAKMSPAQKAAVKKAEVQAAPVTPAVPAAPAAPAMATALATPEKTGEKPAKKESVVQHLADVIKEARQNNATGTTETTSPEAPTKKKRRRRKRKPKTVAQPVRQDTQVNTTSKSEPNKIIKKPNITEGEMSLDDLSKGGEIEINLD